MEYPLKSKKGNVKDKRIIGIYIYQREVWRSSKLDEEEIKRELLCLGHGLSY